MTTDKDKIEFYVIGSKGALRFIYDKGKQVLLRCVGDNVPTDTFEEIEVPEEFKARGQSRSFVDLLMGNKDEYAATISEGLYSQVAVDAAKLSSKLGRAVTVEEMFAGK